MVGYGNQGRAQALCLREAGLDVCVFTRPGPSRDRARSDGFAAATGADIAACRAVAVLVPDEAVDELATSLLVPHAAHGAALIFAHGFALRRPPPLPFRDDLDLVLVGPLGPGTLLLERFREGKGLPGLFAVVRDASGHATEVGLAWAAAIGLTRSGVLATTLDEEVVSDLFAEQVVLVGGAVELMRAAWDVLTEGGVSGEIAYYSCVQELKQILDLVYAAGPDGMRARISGTAQYGGLTRGPRIIGPDVRREMKRALDEIVNGDFAAEWLTERAAGGKELKRLRKEEAAHPMEGAGERVRRELG